MIHSALQAITDQLNAFITAEIGLGEDITAVLSDIVNQAGEMVVTAGINDVNNRVIVTLINVEEETVGKAQLPYINHPDGTVASRNPAIKLNLFLLFSAVSFGTSERYFNCLKSISHVVEFFQYRPLFNHENTPELSTDIEKLTLELVSPTFEEQNHLWGALGAKYIPSVLYKVRMLVIRRAVGEPVSVVEEVSGNLANIP